MKRNLLIVVFILLVAAPEFVMAQIQTIMPSPPASTYSKVGLTDVNINYFRPMMRGRQIFGEGGDFLVPYGQIWRTGANSGTKVSFSDDVTIMGKKISAGEYLLFSKPGASEWTLMLYNDLSIGGNTANYDESKEAGRWTVPASKMAEKVEALTFAVEDIAEDQTKAHLAMMWENTKVELPVEVEYHEKVMASIKENTQVNPNNYVAAASYYYETGQDLDQALEWVNMYLLQRPNAFWNIHLKAQILAKMDKKKEAIEAAEKSIEVAQASGNDFGYVKRNQDLIASLKKK